jgi:lipoic acid synthetase/lipoate-protein ligase A
MVYIVLPETHDVRRLSFFLAMEEYVARHVAAADCFFMWQVEPSVIFGRNQELESEVNVDYCRSHGIQLYRRKSGGGCVYADHDNLMLSFVTSEQNVGFAFNRFVNMLLLVVRKMGVEACGTCHNDILIGNRKVSGTACYHLPDKTIVHGTLLYDTNMEHMLSSITPSQEKLQSKGIQSVRQRITLLKDHVTLSLDEVKTMIRETLCDSSRTLTAEDVAGIEQLEQTYLREEFIYQL